MKVEAKINNHFLELIVTYKELKKILELSCIGLA